MMRCGHPLAARAVRVRADATLWTRCWACEVEAELASRARAKGYNSVAGLAAQSVTIATDADSLLVPGESASLRSRQGLDAR